MRMPKTKSSKASSADSSDGLYLLQGAVLDRGNDASSSSTIAANPSFETEKSSRICFPEDNSSCSQDNEEEKRVRFNLEARDDSLFSSAAHFSAEQRYESCWFTSKDYKGFRQQTSQLARELACDDETSNNNKKKQALSNYQRVLLRTHRACREMRTASHKQVAALVQDVRDLLERTPEHYLGLHKHKVALPASMAQDRDECRQQAWETIQEVQQDPLLMDELDDEALCLQLECYSQRCQLFARVLAIAHSLCHQYDDEATA